MKKSNLIKLVKEELKQLRDQGWRGVTGDPCCHVYQRPGYPPSHVAYNHYDPNGNACTGGCGDQKVPDTRIDHNEQLHGVKTPKLSPYWCCQWDIITGGPVAPNSDRDISRMQELASIRPIKD